jgi:hypothetical protein
MRSTKVPKPGGGNSLGRRSALVIGVAVAAASLTIVLAAQAAFGFVPHKAAFGFVPHTGTGRPAAVALLSTSYPAEYDTGYPHGLPGDTRTPVALTAYTGPCTITAAGTVIDGKDINCRINIRASGVVIKNSRIRVSNDKALYVNDVFHAVIMDTEMDGQHTDNSTGGISLIGDGSYTCVRCNLHGSGDIARANWGGVAIVDSWLHDGYCIQTGCHNDTIQSTGWTNSCTPNVEGLPPVAGSTDTTAARYCIRVVHSRLENQNNQTSNILLKADQGAIHDVLVENNLFNGGGYSFYWYDGTANQISAGLVRNNRFRRDTSVPCKNPDGTLKAVSPNLGSTSVPATKGYWSLGGCFGPVASNVPVTSRYPTWTNNVWDDTGAAIPF